MAVCPCPCVRVHVCAGTRVRGCARADVPKQDGGTDLQGSDGGRWKEARRRPQQGPGPDVHLGQRPHRSRHASPSAAAHRDPWGQRSAPRASRCSQSSSFPGESCAGGRSQVRVTGGQLFRWWPLAVACVGRSPFGRREGPATRVTCAEPSH